MKLKKIPDEDLKRITGALAQIIAIMLAIFLILGLLVCILHLIKFTIGVFVAS